MFVCLLLEEKQSEAPPAVVTSLGYPELTVTVETMGGHVVWYPPCDLNTCTHIDVRTLYRNWRCF